MSMASYEPDWDASTEVRCEERAGRGDLCDRCRENAALPDDEDGLCADCVLDVETALAELQDAA